MKFLYEKRKHTAAKRHKNSNTAIKYDGTPIRFRSFLGTTTRTPTPLRWSAPLSTSLSCNRKIIAANCWIVGKHRAPSAGNSGGGAFCCYRTFRFSFLILPHGRENEKWEMRNVIYNSYYINGNKIYNITYISRRLPSKGSLYYIAIILTFLISHFSRYPAMRNVWET